MAALAPRHDRPDVDVPLNFLGAGKYQALEVHDEQDPAAVKIERAAVERGKTLRVELQPGGGFIGRFGK